jgi:hypothetical protein
VTDTEPFPASSDSAATEFTSSASIPSSSAGPSRAQIGAVPPSVHWSAKSESCSRSSPTWPKSAAPRLTSSKRSGSPSLRRAGSNVVRTGPIRPVARRSRQKLTGPRWVVTSTGTQTALPSGRKTLPAKEAKATTGCWRTPVATRSDMTGLALISALADRWRSFVGATRSDARASRFTSRPPSTRVERATIRSPVSSLPTTGVEIAAPCAISTSQS